MEKPNFKEKYDVVGVAPGLHYVAGFGQVDLVKLDVEEADLLYKQKFPFLKLKDQPNATKSVTKA